MSRWQRYAPIIIFGLLLMIEPLTFEENSSIPSIRCEDCHGGGVQPFTLSVAFRPLQRSIIGPIVGADAVRAYAYETLMRVFKRVSAGSILSRAPHERRYAFDQGCRVRTLTLTMQLGLADSQAQLSIDFMACPI